MLAAESSGSDTVGKRISERIFFSSLPEAGVGTSPPYDAGVPPPLPHSDERPLSALPSRRARALAFAAILVAGLCGALIGSSFVSLQCESACATASGVAAIVGGLLAAGGVAVVAVLVLRAMGEWSRTVDSGLDGNGTAGGAGGAGPESLNR